MAGLTHLLDSDVVVEVLRGRSAALRRRLLDHEGALAVSAVSVSELRFGARRSSRVQQFLDSLDQFLEFVPVLDLDADAALAAGDARAELTGRGTPIGPYDCLIAGQALARGLTVATGNVREFRRVPGLHVENWLR